MKVVLIDSQDFISIMHVDRFQPYFQIPFREKIKVPGQLNCDAKIAVDKTRVFEKVTINETHGIGIYIEVE